MDYYKIISISGQYRGLGMITRPIWKCPCINLYLLLLILLLLLFLGWQKKIIMTLLLLKPLHNFPTETELYLQYIKKLPQLIHWNGPNPKWNRIIQKYLLLWWFLLVETHKIQHKNIQCEICKTKSNIVNGSFV